MADSTLSTAGGRESNNMNGTELPSLFGYLPVQEVSLFRETDEHLLAPCARCGGAGREENPFRRGTYRHLMWEPTCVRCRGTGKILTWIGPVRDAEFEAT